MSIQAIIVSRPLPLDTARRDWKDIQAERADRAREYLDVIRAEKRSSLENPQTPLSFPAEWLLDIFNGGRTDAGIRVSEMTALQVTTVFACVNLISSGMGLLPLHVFELLMNADKRAGKRIAYEHDLYDMLRSEPNDEMTSFTFRKTLQVHALLWGNCYAEIERDGGNRPIGLWPRNPYRTRPYRVGAPTEVNGELVRAGGLVYKTSDGMGELSLNPEEPPKEGTVERTILKEDMLHIPGLALDGRVGQSTIWLARQAVGLALGAEKFGAKFFGNGARTTGVISHPGTLKQTAQDNLRKSIQEAIGGENALRPLLLEEGMKWEQVSTNPNDAQFLETRQFQRAEICGVFQVPPHMIGDTDKTNRANTQQIGVEFVTFTLSPWLEAWQQELKRKLFPKTGRTAGKYFARFETRQLTMPDAASLKDFLTTIKQWGYGSTNDGREMLDLNPIDEPWADQCWMPVNMGVAGQPPPQQQPPPKGASE